jgi:hypothetical protein
LVARRKLRDAPQSVPRVSVRSGVRVESDDAHETKVRVAKRRLAPLLPDIDPGDLDLILRSLFRPFGHGRRFFLRKVRPGVFIY